MVIANAGNGQQERLPIAAAGSAETHKRQRGGQRQRFPGLDFSACQRTIGGTLDVSVEVAVGVVVDRAAGRAHEQRAEHEDADHDPRRRARTTRARAR